MTAEHAEITLDATRLQQAMHEHGFSSATDFAHALGLHRNTVSKYLAGKASLPSALARMLATLELSPAEILNLRLRRRLVPGLGVSSLVDQLHTIVPEAVFALFGSRARGTAKPYSDYDIAVFSPDVLDFARFSRLLDRVSEWNQESLLTAQLVDLSRAEASFLRGLAEDLVFLAGSHGIWCELLRKAGMKLHE